MVAKVHRDGNFALLNVRQKMFYHFGKLLESGSGAADRHQYAQPLSVSAAGAAKVVILLQIDE